MYQLALSVAHHRATPHRSGYPDHLQPQEYPVSYAIASRLAAVLPQHGYAAVSIQKGGHGCGGQCGGLASECGPYRSAHRAQIEHCRGYDLALEFHIDRAPTGSSGPFCLTSGTDRAQQWALAWLDNVEQLYPGIRRRATYINGHRYDGALPITHGRVQHHYGRKGFLLGGADDAVIIELGNVASATDAAAILAGNYTRHAVQAAVAATLATLPAEGE